MLEETVKVVAVQGQTAWVEALASSSCGGCTQACASSALFKQLSRRRTPLALSCDAAVQPGDLLIIGVEERALLWASLLVYVLPLCGLLAGAALAVPIAAAWGVAGDWPSLIGGFSGFAACLIAIKRLPGVGAVRPVVLRRVSGLV